MNKKLVAYILSCIIIVSSFSNAFKVTANAEPAETLENTVAVDATSVPEDAQIAIDTQQLPVEQAMFDAKEVIAMDAKTGEILYAQNAYEALPPASMTKVMTALLTFEAIERGQIALDTPFEVSAPAISTLKYDASYAKPRMKQGEVFNVLELLMMTMLPSDCYACNVLAELIAGNKENFVAMMNQRALELGCTNTNFVNSHGYPADGHVTNAYSMALIAKEAMKYDMFKLIVSMPQAVIPATNMCGERLLENTNELIKPTPYYNPLVKGIKTGSSKAAGKCLVSYATLGDREIITVVMGAKEKTIDGVKIKQQFFETNRLISMLMQ